MNAKSFVTEQTFESIKEKVEKRETFYHAQRVKSGNTFFNLTINSDFTSEENAKRTWNGKRYLIMFNVDYHGALGVGGKGFATVDYKLFKGWETFKAWIDKNMKCYPDYELEEFGQLSLF